MATTTDNINIKINVDATKSEQSTTNYKAKIRELKEEMVQLQVETNGLADATEEQRARYDELQKQAGQLQDALSDVGARIRASADDYQNFNAVMEGAKGLTAFAQGVAGVTSLLGINNDAVTKSIQVMMGLQSVMSSINTVQQMFNKDSKVRIALEKLLTAELTKNKTATVGATAATTAFAAGEGVATTASFTLAAACKAVGVAIKSIPVIGWILAAISALATLVSLIVACNDEEDEGTRLQKEKEANQQAINDAYAEGAKAVAKETRELNNSLASLKNCEKGTDEWKKAAGDVAKTLGVSVDWIEKNEDAVDDLAEAWLRVKRVQATQDALLKNMAENDVKLEQLELAKAELLAASVDTRRSVAEKWAETFGWSESQVDELVDAVNKTKTSNEDKWEKAMGRVDAVINTTKKSITTANAAFEKSYNDLGDSITNDIKKVDKATNESANAAKAASDVASAGHKKTTQTIKDEEKALKELNSEYDKYTKQVQKYSDQYNSNIEEANKATHEGRLENLNREYGKTIQTLDNELEEYKNYYNNLTDEQKAALGDRLVSIEEFENAQAGLRKQALDNYVDGINKETAAEAENYKKRERDAIDAQNEIDNEVLSARLANLKDGSEEYFELQQEIEEERWEQQMEDLRRRLEDKQLTQAEFDELETEYFRQHQQNLTAIQDEEDRKRIELTENRISTVGSILSNMSNFVSTLMETELEEAEGNERKQKEIKKKYATAQAMMKIGQIGIDTALGIMGVWSQVMELGPIAGPILGAILSATIGALGIANTAKAIQEKNKIMKAKRGAYIVGPSHAEGGVPYELEGGEAVLNKRAMSIPAYRNMASAMNVATGGVAFPGTNPNAGMTAMVDRNALKSIVQETVAGIAAIPVVVSEESITNAQRNVGVSVERSRI